MTIFSVQNRLGRYYESVLDLRRIPQDGCRPRNWSNEACSVYSVPRRASNSTDKQRAAQTVDKADRRLVMLWLQVLPEIA
jgi:hypothetical protein